MSENRFKSTAIFGTFENSDMPDGSIHAAATFDRNVLIKGSLTLGTEIAGSPIVDSGGGISFSIQGTVYTITNTMLSFLNNVTSNIQTQLNLLTSSLTNYLTTAAAAATYATISMPTFTGLLSANNGIYVQANSQSVPTQSYGLNISNNYILGSGETDFINCYTVSNTTAAFNFLQKLTSTTTETLMQITQDGSVKVFGENFEILNNFIGPNFTLTQTSLGYLSSITSDLQTQLNNLSNNFTNYLTTTNAASIYATISSLSNYLTISAASSTYATLSSLGNYLTTTAAAATYATISNPNFTGSAYASGGMVVTGGSSIPSSSAGVWITYNQIGGLGEVDFMNLSYNSSDFSFPAFVFLQKTSGGSYQTLLRINESGEMDVSGDLKLSGSIFSGSSTIPSYRITPSIFSYLSNITSDVQAQINGLKVSITACGVFMIDTSNNYWPLPMSFTNTTISSYSGPNNIISGNDGTSSSIVYGSSSSISVLPNDSDRAYIICPYYGLKVYGDGNYSGSVTLDIWNQSPLAKLFVPTNPATASSWKVFYDGTQI